MFWSLTSGFWNRFSKNLSLWIDLSKCLCVCWTYHRSRKGSWDIPPHTLPTATCFQKEAAFLAWSPTGSSLALQPYLLSLFTQPSPWQWGRQLVISQRCCVPSPLSAFMPLMINKDRRVQKTETHSTPTLNVPVITVWRHNFNHLGSLKPSPCLYPGEPSPKSLV